MGKKKILIIVSIVIIALLAGLMLFLDGIIIGISGVISFTTKYYETPQEAYEHFESQPLKISRSVDFIQIDEYNGMFIGMTEDEETETYVFVSMQTKNKKYFCSGYYSIMENSQNSEDIVLQGNKVLNKIYLYGDGGWCQGQYEYMIVYDEKDIQELDGNYKMQYITSQQDNGFYFVFRII